MSALDVVLGVDVGSTRCKAVVMTTGGRRLATGEIATRWDTSAGEAAGGGGRGREQAQAPAERFVDGVRVALTRAVEAAEATAGSVQAIGVGITGMSEAGVLVGPDRAPRAPVLAWFDGRGRAQADRLAADMGDRFTELTGLPPSPLCSLVKLLWMRDELGVPLAGARWLSVPEYVAFELAGAGAEPAAEPSLAARTGLLDLDRGVAWDGAEELLGAPGLLPPLVDAGRPVGRLAAAGLPGALASAVLTVAGHDHPVAAIGAGATGADDLFDSCGTAQALVRSTATPPSPATRVRLAAQGLNTGRHPLPGQWMILGGTRGGLLLRRILALLGVTSLERQLELDARALPLLDIGSDIEIGGAMGVDSAGISVLLAGDDIGPEQLWAAALEHAVRISGRKVQAIDEAIGPHGRVVAAGGWTRVEGYRRRKRAAVPGVEFSAEAEPGGRGAAMLAAVAAAGLDPVPGVRRVFR